MQLCSSMFCFKLLIFLQRFNTFIVLKKLNTKFLKYVCWAFCVYISQTQGSPALAFGSSLHNLAVPHLVYASQNLDGTISAILCSTVRGWRILRDEAMLSCQCICLLAQPSNILVGKNYLTISMHFI